MPVTAELSKLKGAFTRKLGPLPVWAWGAIGVGGYIAYRWWTGGSSTADQGADASTGGGSSGGGGLGGAPSGSTGVVPTTATTPDTTTPTSATTDASPSTKAVKAVKKKKWKPTWSPVWKAGKGPHQPGTHGPNNPKPKPKPGKPGHAPQRPRAGSGHIPNTTPHVAAAKHPSSNGRPKVHK